MVAVFQHERTDVTSNSYYSDLLVNVIIIQLKANRTDMTRGEVKDQVLWLIIIQPN